MAPIIGVVVLLWTKGSVRLAGDIPSSGRLQVRRTASISIRAMATARRPFATRAGIASDRKDDIARLQGQITSILRVGQAVAMTGIFTHSIRRENRNNKGKKK